MLEIQLVLASWLDLTRWTFGALLLMKCIFCILERRQKELWSNTFFSRLQRAGIKCCRLKRESLCSSLSGFCHKQKNELSLSGGVCCCMGVIRVVQAVRLHDYCRGSDMTYNFKLPQVSPTLVVRSHPQPYPSRTWPQAEWHHFLWAEKQPTTLFSV